MVSAGAGAELTALCTADRFRLLHAERPGWVPGAARAVARHARHARHPRGELRDGPGRPDCAVGARFDDRITGKLSEFAPHAKFIHIDIDPAEISKNVPAHIPIVGDAKNVLHRLLIEYRALDTDPSRLDEWWQHIGGWQEKHPLRYDESADAEIKPQRAIEAIYEVTEGDAIVTSDVGQHQMWAAQYYHFAKPRRWLNSGGLGTMGFGFPAAMGAALGCPDETVVCITGDGSFQMNAQELATVAENQIPVKIMLLNNGFLGMVRQQQEQIWERRYSHVDLGQTPDFVKLATAYGIAGVRLDDKTTLVDDLRAALATDGPVLVDIAVAREENVFPIVYPGAAARDMVG